MADLATLQARLTEAETALHNLAIGARVVDVWKDGRRVRYSEATKSQLEAYIKDLNDQITDAQATSTDLPRRRFIGVSLG